MFIKTGSESYVLFCFKKKSQLKSRKAYKNRKGQADKTGKRRASLKKEGMVRFTRARTHVTLHMCMYTIQRYWYDTIHGISKLRIFPIWRIWVHIIVTCTEDTAIHRVCAVYANTATYSRRNKTYGSPLGWLWIAAQQCSSHRHKVLYEFKCTAVCTNCLL